MDRTLLIYKRVPAPFSHLGRRLAWRILRLMERGRRMPAQHYFVRQRPWIARARIITL
jgi:hypothetical protein